MQHQITIREAVADADIARFWEQLYRYYARDIFIEAGSGEREHFIGPEYYGHMMKIRSRPQDRAYFLFFVRDGQEIGFAMPVIYGSEDGKCFLLEFCVYPAFRGNGTGHACTEALLAWARARGMRAALARAPAHQTSSHPRQSPRLHRVRLPGLRRARIPYPSSGGHRRTALIPRRHRM